VSWFGPKCLHSWEVKAKTFAPPRQHEFTGTIRGGPGSGLLPHLERCAAGVTTVLMVCTKCGKADVTEMLGKEGA
jgi:hypothetical protein